MRTYKVSYRLVPHTLPHVSIVFTYTVDAVNEMSAEGQVVEIMVDDAQHLLGRFDNDIIKRVTIVRIK